jgi:hypothetical protein
MDVMRTESSSTLDCTLFIEFVRSNEKALYDPVAGLSMSSTTVSQELASILNPWKRMRMKLPPRQHFPVQIDTKQTPCPHCSVVSVLTSPRNTKGLRNHVDERDDLDKNLSVTGNNV